LLSYRKDFGFNLGLEENDNTLLKELNQVMEMKNTGIMMDDEKQSEDQQDGYMDFDPVQDSFE
jgi:hypothetical protein